MKARVKATGEIVDVMYSHTAHDKGYDIIWYCTLRGACFSKEELEFIDTGESLDYWTRLEHQYAGMAMQGILSSHEVMKRIAKEKCNVPEVVAKMAIESAHALVEKLKNEQP